MNGVGSMQKKIAKGGLFFDVCGAAAVYRHHSSQCFLVEQLWVDLLRGEGAVLGVANGKHKTLPCSRLDGILYGTQIQSCENV